jgi:glucoamylase
MASYRDPQTGLPGPSYDLWEERRGICTFTCSTVVAGLNAAAEFAQAFGEESLAREYAGAAREIRDAMDRYLFRPELGRFARMIQVAADGTIHVDQTIDASLFGIFAFGTYPADDPRVVATMGAVRDQLTCRNETGGVARYRGDYYHQISSDLDQIPGNPWFICTLWLGMHAVASAQRAADLTPARDILCWVLAHQRPSGILAEQLDPIRGTPLSVSPLAWSHAALVELVEDFLDKERALRMVSGQRDQD